MVAEAGDPFARSVQLDNLVIEDELEEFFVGLMEYCQQFGRELKKPDLGTEAVLLCRDFRAATKKMKRRLVTDQDHEVQLRQNLFRGMELKEEVLGLYGRGDQ